MLPKREASPRRRRPERRQPRLELVEIAREFRHLRGEHARERPNSSLRRRHGALLAELERRLETLLEHWVQDAGERERWRAYLHHGASAPELSIPDGPLYEESFDWPPEAVGELAADLRGKLREPPWHWATVLYGDGIIDTTFALTERGRRLRRVHAPRV